MILATFWSDPHLGVCRMAHTTPESRERLGSIVCNAAVDAAELPFSVCLGDLFDKFSNDEKTIAQGAFVAKRCAMVLAGNHDSSNRTDSIGSLDLVASFEKNTVVRESSTFSHDSGKCVLAVVPHKMTQTLFEQSLDEVKLTTPKAETTVLLLHCNYDAPAASLAREDTLNLTREKAADLLELFDFIFIGHEHNSRADFDGRLICVGTTFPTSFSDCKTDKFVWVLHDDKKLERKKVWSASTGYMEIEWEDLMTLRTAQPDVQFISVTGVAPANRMPEIAKACHKLWQEYPDALMIRNIVEAQNIELAPSIASADRAMSVPDKISAELAGTEVGETWKNYFERCVK